MLRDWLVTQLECMNLPSKVWIQQDTAPVHYVISVWDYLSDVFYDKLISCGSANLVTPLEWPPISPNLSSCYVLWGTIKHDISQKHYQTTEELKGAVCNVFVKITSAMSCWVGHGEALFRTSDMMTSILTLLTSNVSYALYTIFWVPYTCKLIIYQLHFTFQFPN
jgi:hypothetical protein